MLWVRLYLEDIFLDFFINRSFEKNCGYWSWYLVNDKCICICLLCFSEGYLLSYF